MSQYRELDKGVSSRSCLSSGSMERKDARLRSPSFSSKDSFISVKVEEKEAEERRGRTRRRRRRMAGCGGAILVWWRSPGCIGATNPPLPTEANVTHRELESSLLSSKSLFPHHEDCNTLHCKYKYTNTQKQIYKYTNTQIHKYTNTQIH